tara:strand:- start:536 stop:1285 length:750 start_codon:yes stop_codon:yes gene_type:complete
MTGLLLHCGAEAIERDAIKNLPVKRATKTHHPVSNERLVNLTHDALGRHGFRVLDEAYGAKPDGSRFFGLIGLESKLDPSFQNVFGLRNCDDKKFILSGIHGIAPFICDNLQMTGDIILSRKHNSPKINDELPEMLNDAVAKLGETFGRQHARIERYKSVDLSSQMQQHDLTVRMAERGAINYRQIPKVLGEFRAPRHDEFKGESLWHFMQSVTEHSKGRGGVNHLETLRHRTQLMHSIFDAECPVENN